MSIPKKKTVTTVQLKNYDYLRYTDRKASDTLTEACRTNNVYYFQITTKFNNERTTSSFYKYLDLESAFLSLKNGNLKFVEPTRWEDKYEGRFYNADYKNVSANPDKDAPFLYACCVTNKPHNEAAWKVYTYGKTGMGNHCVQLKINREKFRLELAKNVSGINTIMEGQVFYYSENLINEIHKKEIRTKAGKKRNINYDNIFGHFDFVSYMNLLLLKRDFFFHESEVRLFIIPEKAPQKKAKLSKGQYGTEIYVPITWANIIEEIRIDSRCSDLEYELFKEQCLKMVPKLGLNPGHAEKVEHDKMIKKFTPIKTDIYGKRMKITIE